MRTKHKKPSRKKPVPAANKDLHGSNGSVRSPYGALYQGDFLLSPYRAMAEVFLQSQHSAVTAMEVNLRLAHEMGDILRHEQDIIGDVFARTLRRASDSGEASARSLASQSRPTGRGRKMQPGHLQGAGKIHRDHGRTKRGHA